VGLRWAGGSDHSETGDHPGIDNFQIEQKKVLGGGKELKGAGTRKIGPFHQKKDRGKATKSDSVKLFG